MLATLLLAAIPAPAPAPQEIPYEALAREYLALIEAPAEPLIPSRGERAPALLDVLRDGHRVLDLGALELWIPRRSLRSSGSPGPGLAPREARAWARQLLQLQGAWVELLLEGDVRAARLADLALLAEWVAALDKGDLADAQPEPELRRARTALRALFPAQSGDDPPTLLIAPTRRHLVAAASAVGWLLPGERERLWSADLLAVGYTYPRREVVWISLETGPPAGSDGLVGMSVAREDVQAVVVHRAAHFLIERALPRAPLWLREGLALDATIAITGGDDSPCTGFTQRDEMANVLWLPLWIEADLSPYREGPSASWFEKQLRPDRRGRFPIWDLDRSKIELHLAGPFLGGGRDGPPEEVLDAGRGVERGYAEFLRAYSAACVHWLSLEQVGGRPVLSWLIEFLRDPRRHGGLRPAQLVPTGLQMITQKTFGRSSDPEQDLEAAFARWLAKR